MLKGHVLAPVCVQVSERTRAKKAHGKGFRKMGGYEKRNKAHLHTNMKKIERERERARERDLK